jgi:hypothetical protein
VARTSDVKWVTAGVEVAASRRATWVALCGVAKRTKRVHVHVGDPLDGSAVTGQLVALWEKHELDGFALDPRSPSSTLVEPLKAEGMVLRLADAIGVATAHGRFRDLLYADRLRAAGHPALDEAVFAAEARRLAGSEAVDRYADGGVDMAPLMAAELAVWMLGDPDEAEGITPGVWVFSDSPGDLSAGTERSAPVPFEQWPDGVPPWVQRQG